MIHSTTEYGEMDILHDTKLIRSLMNGIHTGSQNYEPSTLEHSYMSFPQDNFLELKRQETQKKSRRLTILMSYITHRFSPPLGNSIT